MQKYKDELKIKKRKKLIFRLALYILAGIIVLAGVAYLLFFVKLFDVRAVNIQAPDSLRGDLGSSVDSWLDSGFWKFTRRNNILFFPTKKMSIQLAEQFPKLESIKITKKLPHSLVVSGEERRPVGIWCLVVSGKCFYFDKNGVAFSETQSSIGFLVLNVNDQRSRDLRLGEKVIADNWLASITKARDLLTRSGISVSEFVIPADSFDEFHAKTAEGWKLLLGNSTNIDKQIDALNIFLKDKLKPAQRAALQYVDLRIQDRIYYK